MNKTVIIGGVLVLLTISLGGYLLKHKNKLGNLTAQKEEIQANLNVAKKTLNTETERLDNMTNSLRNAFPLASNLQDQMTRSAKIVKNTNFIFRNAESSNPEIIIKGLENAAFINSQRKEINQFLARWKGKTSILSISELDVTEAEKIKQEAEEIKKYINNLSELIANLTPANSGLSQFTINAYANQLPTVKSVEIILTTIESAIADPNTLNFQIVSGSGSSTNNNNQASTGSNTSTPISTSSNLSTAESVSVTPAIVVAQQSVVVNAQTQINNLQQQLAQIEVQIAQVSPALVPAPVPSPVTQVNPPPASSTTTNSTYSFSPNSRIFIPNQGIIIIQPGPVRLIQGTDPF